MRFLVHGRGLAAALTIDALVSEGVAPEEIWTTGTLAPPAGSLAPAALLNPLTGRSLKPPIEGPGVFRAAQKTWSRLKDRYPQLVSSVIVHRPFISGHKLFEKLERTFTEHQQELVQGWDVREPSPKELSQLRATTVSNCTGAMTIDGAFAVQLPQFLEAFWSELTKLGVKVAQESLDAEITIRCDGAALRENLPSSIRLEPLGGELFEVSPIHTLEAGHALAGDGHYIRINDQRAIVGSTYHRHGQPLVDAPWTHLNRRLESWLPSLEGPPKSSWYGERLIVPDDRKPIVGATSQNDSTYLCTGFASKGLYWAPFATHALARHILFRESLPDAISIARF